MTLFVVISSTVPGSDTANVWVFEGKLLGGVALMIGTAWLVFRRAFKRKGSSR
jgi:nitrate reductase gamma subunit